MKVIFLDIDGVLNTYDTMKLPESFVNYGGRQISFNRFNADCVRRLNRITDETGAKLVISSTWRIIPAADGTFHLLVDHLKKEGVTGEVIGHTPLDRECGYVNEYYPDGSRGIRGIEIQKWLDDNKDKNVEKFIMIDDSADMAHLKEHLVYIEYGWGKGGILDKHVDEAIDRLAGKKCWTCGKRGCSPMEHAGWHPDDDKVG